MYIDKEIIESKLGLRAPAIERLLGLPMRSLTDRKFVELPETQAVLRILYTMPWILELVQHNFDPVIAEALLIRESAKITIENRAKEIQGIPGT